MRKIIFVALVLYATNILKAQNQIQGKVLEISKEGVSVPVFGANVYWEGTSQGVVTDINGNYSILEAQSFPATLSVSYVGYTVDTNIFIDNKYVFYLKSSVDLDQVDIEGYKKTTNISLVQPINIQTLTTGEIQKAACCNLSECFETNNSVDVTYSDAMSGIKKIQMLGLDGQYIQITSELMPLVRGMQRSYGLTYVPGSWIESIQIIKGSGSVVNGFESLTGQINVEYFKPDNDIHKLKWNIYANNSGKFENNLILSKNKGSWRSNLFTHITYFNNEKDQNGDYFLDMPRCQLFSFLNRWQYFGSDKYRFQINLRGIYDDRRGGHINEVIDNPYIANINNQIIQFYAKAGKIIDSSKSIGSQTSITLHNQSAQFGERKYEGISESISFNFIYQNQINDKNLIKYGSSFFYDRLIESFAGSNVIESFNSKERLDIIPGLFGEHQFNNTRLNIITGLRTDYYNLEERIYYSPRLNIKYNIGDRSALRLSSGRAFRISNPFVDNMQYLASSRKIIIATELKPEIGWNHGLNYSYCFYLFDKEGTLNIDLYRTIFENQITVDVESKDELKFNNLNGNSFANIIQFDLDYNISSNIDVRLSYKANKSVSTFNGVQKVLPLLPKERRLINFSYKDNTQKWNIDVSLNYIGSSRVPETDNINTFDEFSSSFTLFNSQLTYKWNSIDIYIGGENIMNYTQSNPIIDPENPFGEDFDASLIWGPVMGRTIYLGLRYNVN